MAKRYKRKPTKLLGKPGMPPFVPTKEQRAWVLQMAGLKMSWDEIASLIVNPRTKQAISKETLGKAFAHELAIGRQHLKRLIGNRYYDRLGKGEPWAIQYGFRHIFKWRDTDSDVTIGVNGGSETNPASMIEVRFVKARERSDDDEE